LGFHLGLQEVISALGIDRGLIMGNAETTLPFGWKLPICAVSCRCHANGDEWRQTVTKTEKRRSIWVSSIWSELAESPRFVSAPANCD